MTTTARAGYTLPVFACASAIAALRKLIENNIDLSTVHVDLIEPPTIAEIAIAQLAQLKSNTALAVTYSDPGDNIDLTRNTPIWAMVELLDNCQPNQEQITILGGEGIGRNQETGNAAIYNYAEKLIKHNLKKYLSPDQIIQVTIILPFGKQLAERTSNQAFGIIEGLSLLGTSGISQPLSSPGQLADYCQQLENKAEKFDTVVFCVGENGLDLANQLGIPAECLVKTANWLGPMLVTAGMVGIKSLLLFGYHGKLIKIAGGIFHTHHFLADGRLAILTAHAAHLGLPQTLIQEIFTSTTTDQALQFVMNWDRLQGTDWANILYRAIALTIDEKSQAYIQQHSEATVKVGSILFNRQRQIIVESNHGSEICQQLMQEKS
ncbi:MAG: cobalt-precorrin-5B (C(1))-methyltransferase CbiD [Microcoleaceae cyanobacterium]